MLVTSLALNLWSWQIIDRQPQREASERFDLQQDRIIRATENRMLAYQNILDGAQGLLAPGGFMPIGRRAGWRCLSASGCCAAPFSRCEHGNARVRVR